MTTAKPYEIAVCDTSTVLVYENVLLKDPDGCRIDLMEKVCDQRKIFNSNSVRRLIIEMYSVYDKCQKASESDRTLDTSISCTFSRAYRSVLLNAAITHNNEEFIHDFTLWSLYEKLYFNRGDGSICGDLISWANESFTFLKTLLEKSADEYEPGSSVQNEEYWKGVAVSLLCCHFQECADLLSLVSGDPAVDLFLKTLESFDVEWLNDEAKTDRMKQWKQTISENLQCGKYGTNENIIFLSRLLLGDDIIFKTIAKRIISNWWNVLPFYILMKNPLSNYQEFVDLAQNCFSIYNEETENENENMQEDVFWCVVSRDEASFYQLIMKNPWISVHLVDLIHKSTLDPELEELRKNLIMSYSSSLITHSNLWEIGVGYLLRCGIEGLLRLESHIEGMHIEDDEMAEKLVDICEEYRLNDAKNCVTNTMTFRYLRIEEWGAALGWALRSGIKKTIDTTVSKIIECSSRRDLANLSVLNSLSEGSVLSLPSLTFLFSYQRFMKILQTRQVDECLKLLIPLIMMTDVPTNYYCDLFEYLITIMQGKECIGFPVEVLYELSTFLARFSLDKDSDLDYNFIGRVKILKKMVLLKMAESVSRGISMAKVS